MIPRSLTKSFLRSGWGLGLLILSLSAAVFVSGCTEAASAANEAETSSAKNEAKAPSTGNETEQSSAKSEAQESTAKNQAKAQQQPTPLTPPFDLTDPARIADGKARFNSTCATFCHGKNPPLFIGRTDLTAQYVYIAIREGGIGRYKPMPAWGNIFTPEQIWELVAYIKSLGKW